MLLNRVHDLKCDPQAFEPVSRGDKTHEIRLNDRGFKVGDLLRLHETRYSGDEMRAGRPLVYTGRQARRVISHIQEGYGLEPGWCVLSFEHAHRSARGDAYARNASRVLLVESAIEGLQLRSGDGLRVDLVAYTVDVFRDDDAPALLRGRIPARVRWKDA